MEHVATGWCTSEKLRLDQTIRNFSCSDLEIPFVVNRLGGTGLKKNAFIYFLTLFRGRGGERVV